MFGDATAYVRRSRDFNDLVPTNTEALKLFRVVSSAYAPSNDEHSLPSCNSDIRRLEMCIIVIVESNFTGCLFEALIKCE